MLDGLFAFAEANRDELTDNGRHKTVKLPTGVFAWRVTPPAVNLKNVKAIIEAIKSLGLTGLFLRTKEEIDKEAMLREPEKAGKIKGVVINQHEEFVVKPEESQVEITSNVDKLRKRT